MVYGDLRQYLTKLEEEGELVRVNCEVDTHLEVGAITRRVQDLRAPAPLFENLKGYPAGYRIAACTVGATKPILQGRVALAMGLPKDTPVLSIIEEFKKRMDKRIPPKSTTNAPCKENVFVGDKIDVTKFPAPFVHEGDGGPFLGTWHVCVTKDPDTGWINWSVYRLMVHDKKTIGIMMGTDTHGFNMYQRYSKKGKNMPIAIAIGTDPLTTIAARTTLSFADSEASLAGGLRGSPVEVTKCETSDLEVPASAEIVIEGEIPIEERRDEGPFGEFVGYFAGGRSPQPVVRIKCLSHRNDPILTMTNLGKPWDESAITHSIASSAIIAKLLDQHAIPYKAVFVRPVQTPVISIKPRAGLMHKIATTLWGGSARTGSHRILFVDEDVDVTNLEDVWWCMMTRIHPKYGVHTIDGIKVIPLLPWLTPEERVRQEASAVYFDATFPYTWTKEYRNEHTNVVDFEHAWPQHIQKEVLSRWHEYGYKED